MHACWLAAGGHVPLCGHLSIGYRRLPVLLTLKPLCTFFYLCVHVWCQLSLCVHVCWHTVGGYVPLCGHLSIGYGCLPAFPLAQASQPDQKRRLRNRARRYVHVHVVVCDVLCVCVRVCVCVWGGVKGHFGVGLRVLGGIGILWAAMSAHHKIPVQANLIGKHWCDISPIQAIKTGIYTAFTLL